MRTWAKLSALTSQKRGHNTFVGQVGGRGHERQSHGKALRANGTLSGDDVILSRASKMLQAKVSHSSKEKEQELQTRLCGTVFRV